MLTKVSKFSNLHSECFLVDWLGSTPDNSTVLTVLIVLVLSVNYFTNLLVLYNENLYEERLMDKMLRHTKFLLLSGLMTVSAVGASAVSAGLISRKDLEISNSLGPHQKTFPL